MQIRSIPDASPSFIAWQACPKALFPSPKNEGQTIKSWRCSVTRDEGVALIDPSGSQPVLRRFVHRVNWTGTFPPPGSFLVFLSEDLQDGPTGAFTGSGSAAPGSSIAWGVVTGWTVTGSFWCKSFPSVCAALPAGEAETTVDPVRLSEFYDLGTWFFHTTGFTAVPFVHEYSNTDFGDFRNGQRWVRGFQVFDATVPALPLLGTLLLGGSLALGAFSELRRRRRTPSAIPARRQVG